VSVGNADSHAGKGKKIVWRRKRRCCFKAWDTCDKAACTFGLRGFPLGVDQRRKTFNLIVPRAFPSYATTFRYQPVQTAPSAANAQSTHSHKSLSRPLDVRTRLEAPQPTLPSLQASPLWRRNRKVVHLPSLVDNSKTTASAPVAAHPRRTRAAVHVEGISAPPTLVQGPKPSSCSTVLAQAIRMRHET
jgi:hypothetical protein